jgi:hypothetical protein
MIATSFWEAYVEGRNCWDKKKLGWKLKIGKHFVLPAYHFYLFVIMWPLLLSLPLVIYGWNTKLFGILFSAYLLGATIEDIGWYVVNPKVKFKEFFTSFSDYFPWIKINGKKIIPVNYVVSFILALLSWYFLWR